MKIEVAPAGTDPTKRRYAERRGGGGEFIQENKWLLLGVLVFMAFTAFRFGWFSKPEIAAAPVVAPVAAVAVTPERNITPERSAAPAGWCAGPLPVAGFEAQIKPGGIYEPGRYVLALEDDGSVKISAECANGAWVFFKAEPSPHGE